MPSKVSRKKPKPRQRITGSITDYVQAAMSHATYDKLEDGMYWGEIPEVEGVWAWEKALEDCRDELQSALEDWILFSLVNDFGIPEVDGFTLYAAKVAMAAK